jgi:hypothetical protein
MLKIIKHENKSKGRPKSCKFTSVTVLACQRSYLLNALLDLIPCFCHDLTRPKSQHLVMN